MRKDETFVKYLQSIKHFDTRSKCYAISSSYARKISRTAASTYPDRFHHDDVLFTGILRVKADIDIPTEVNDICTHYNNETKIKDIRNVVLEYCIKNDILESHCIIE